MIAIMFMYFIVRTILFVRKSNREESVTVRLAGEGLTQGEKAISKAVVLVGFNLIAFVICCAFKPIFLAYLVGDIAYPVYKMSTKK